MARIPASRVRSPCVAAGSLRPAALLGEGQEWKNPVTRNSQSEVPSGEKSGGIGKSHVTIGWLACSRALPYSPKTTISPVRVLTAWNSRPTPIFPVSVLNPVGPGPGGSMTVAGTPSHVPTRTTVFFRSRATRLEHVQAHPSDNRRQPPGHVLDGARVGTPQPQPRLLDRVVRFGHRAEHPVGHRAQARSVLFEPDRQRVVSIRGHIPSLCSVISMTTETHRM